MESGNIKTKGIDSQSILGFNVYHSINIDSNRMIHSFKQFVFSTPNTVVVEQCTLPQTKSSGLWSFGIFYCPGAMFVLKKAIMRSSGDTILYQYSF